jgi:hypothetical protein
MPKCKRPTFNVQRPTLNIVRSLTLTQRIGYFATAQNGGVAKW